MRVFIRKPCFSTHLRRWVEVGEIVDVPTCPQRCVDAGLVIIVPDVPDLPDPDKITDFGYRDRPVRYKPSAETR